MTHFDFQTPLQVNRFGDVQDLCGRTVGRVGIGGSVRFNTLDYPSSGTINNLYNRIDHGINNFTPLRGYDAYQREKLNFYTKPEPVILPNPLIDYCKKPVEIPSVDLDILKPRKNYSVFCEEPSEKLLTAYLNPRKKSSLRIFPETEPLTLYPWLNR